MRMQLEFPKEGSGNTERKHDPQVYRGDENFKAAEAVSSANPTSENLKTAARDISSSARKRNRKPRKTHTGTRAPNLQETSSPSPSPRLGREGEGPSTSSWRGRRG